jgi:tyrosine-protein phosphatase YwqE
MSFDPHIHLLPNMADGPINLSDLEAMLRIMNQNGIRRAIGVTAMDPFQVEAHSFLRKLRLSGRSVIEMSKKHRYAMDFRFAPQIEFHEGVFRALDMHPYLVPKTNFLMVDLPLGILTDESVRDLAYLIQKQRICPIICHIERHILLDEKSSLERLLGISNAYFLLSSTSLVFRNIVDVMLRAIRTGKRFLLASNAHNSTTRRPLYSIEEMNAGDAYTRSALRYLTLETLSFCNAVFQRS